MAVICVLEMKTQSVDWDHELLMVLKEKCKMEHGRLRTQGLCAFGSGEHMSQ
jgi:hypothetical protein